MAQKKTYIYRMLIGYNENTEVDLFIFARNSSTATDYCKELYRDKKYSYYKSIKVGISHWLRETEIITGEMDKKLRNSIASKGDSYREREVAMPKYITRKEAGGLI